MPEPTDADRLVAIAAEAQRLKRALDKQQAEHAQERDELRGALSDAFHQIADLNEAVRSLADGISAANQDQASETAADPGCWITITDPALAAHVMTDLVDWLGDVYVHYCGGGEALPVPLADAAVRVAKAWATHHRLPEPIDLDLEAARRYNDRRRQGGSDTAGAAPLSPLAACWAWHPWAVEDLLALRRAHHHAYRPRGTPRERLDWRTTHLPDIAKGVTDRLMGCQLKAHRSGPLAVAS